MLLLHPEIQAKAVKYNILYSIPSELRNPSILTLSWPVETNFMCGIVMCYQRLRTSIIPLPPSLTPHPNTVDTDKFHKASPPREQRRHLPIYRKEKRVQSM